MTVEAIYAQQTFEGDGSTVDFDVNYYPSDSQEQALFGVKVEVDGEEVDSSDYSVAAATPTASDARITFNTAPINASQITISRMTPQTSRPVNFNTGTKNREEELDYDSIYAHLLMQELKDMVRSRGLWFRGSYDAAKDYTNGNVVIYSGVLYVSFGTNLAGSGTPDTLPTTWIVSTSPMGALLLTGGTMSGDIDMDGNSLLNVNDADFDHDALTNTHNLTTDIDHDTLTNTHNLTTDVDHDTLTNTHNLTTDIDHDTLTNNHNLTTDIDHDQLTNFAADEHVAHSGVSISGGTSLSGGGAIDANRTLTLLNDSASPGNSKYYGTDGGGTKGFHSLTAVSSDGDAKARDWASSFASLNENFDFSVDNSAKEIILHASGQLQNSGNNWEDWSIFMRRNSAGTWTCSSYNNVHDARTSASSVITIEPGASTGLQFTVTFPDSSTVRLNVQDRGTASDYTMAALCRSVS